MQVLDQIKQRQNAATAAAEKAMLAAIDTVWGAVRTTRPLADSQVDELDAAMQLLGIGHGHLLLFAELDAAKARLETTLNRSTLAELDEAQVKAREALEATKKRHQEELEAATRAFHTAEGARGAYVRHTESMERLRQAFPAWLAGDLYSRARAPAGHDMTVIMRDHRIEHAQGANLPLRQSAAPPVVPSGTATAPNRLLGDGVDVISIREPWASLLVYGLKTLIPWPASETAPGPGWVAICTDIGRDEHDVPKYAQAIRQRRPEGVFPDLCIVGLVRVVSCCKPGPGAADRTIGGPPQDYVLSCGDAVVLKKSWPYAWKSGSRREQFMTSSNGDLVAVCRAAIREHVEAEAKKQAEPEQVAGPELPSAADDAPDQHAAKGRRKAASGAKGS